MCDDYKNYGVCTAIGREIPVGENICGDCPCREEIVEYQLFSKLAWREESTIKDGQIKRMRVTGDHKQLVVEVVEWLEDE